MKYIIFTIIGVFISAAAQAACYSSSEFEAEQGLRIHSELMVIALNCQHVKASNGNLYYQYKNFTRQHQGLIGGYENTLKSFYGRNGNSNPEKEINDLRTKLANKISNDAARMKPNVFCKTYGSRITQALQMPQEKLRRWASTPFQGFPTAYPICASQ